MCGRRAPRPKTDPPNSDASDLARARAKTALFPAPGGRPFSKPCGARVDGPRPGNVWKGGLRPDQERRDQKGETEECCGQCDNEDGVVEAAVTSKVPRERPEGPQPRGAGVVT